MYYAWKRLEVNKKLIINTMGVDQLGDMDVGGRKISNYICDKVDWIKMVQDRMK